MLAPAITPKQRKFLEATTRGRIYAGGISSGKTRVLCYAGILGALRGENGCIVSFSYRNLADVIVPTMDKCFERMGLQEGIDWVFLKTDMVYRIHNTRLLLRSADEPSRLRGLNLGFFLVDEAREFKTDETYMILLGRIREITKAWWAICSTTKGKNWMYQLVDQAGLTSAFEAGYAANDDLTVICQATDENYFIPDTFLADIKSKYTGKYAQQELYGQIVDWSAGIFRPEWYQLRDAYYKPARGVRYWDVAASVKTSADYTVGLLMARNGSVYNIVDVIRVRGYDRELIIKTAQTDGQGVQIALESVGVQLALITDLMRDPRLAQYRIRAHNISTDKLARALPLQSRMEQGILRLCNGTWNQEYIDELTAFDGQLLGHDDQVDATSGAWDVINTEAAIKVPDTNKVVWNDMESTELIHLGAIEVLDFTAYMVRCAWHPHTETLQVTGELVTRTVNEITDYLQPCRNRYGSTDLDSESTKSLLLQLVARKCPIITGKLDVAGAVAYINQMIMRGKVHIPDNLRCYADLITSDPESITPLVRCVLRLVDACKGYARPKEKQYGPFEQQREEWRKKHALELSTAPKEWINR